MLCCVGLLLCSFCFSFFLFLPLPLHDFSPSIICSALSTAVFLCCSAVFYLSRSLSVFTVPASIYLVVFLCLSHYWTFIRSPHLLSFWPVFVWVCLLFVACVCPWSQQPRHLLSAVAGAGLTAGCAAWRRWACLSIVGKRPTRPLLSTQTHDTFVFIRIIVGGTYWETQTLSCILANHQLYQ